MFLLNLLAIKRLRERPLVVGLAITGVAAGVALAVSVAALLSSLSRSIEDATLGDGPVGLALMARSPLGFNEALAERALDDAAVTAVVPELRQPVMVGELPVLLIGRADIDAATAGSALAADATSRVIVTTAAGTNTLSIDPAPGDLAAVNAGRVLFVPLATAQDLTGRVGVVDSATLVLGNAGELDATDRGEIAERLERRLGGSVFVTDADAVRTYALDQIAQVQQPVILMAGIALVAGAAMVFNTVQSSARQRARELAVLRAVGATKTQVAASVMTEAVLLGLAGSILGLVGGLWLSRVIVGALPSIVSTAAGTEVTFHAATGVIGLAFATGLGSSVASAIVPARRIARSQPNQVLQRRPPSKERWSRSTAARVAGVGTVVAIAGVAMSLSDRLEIAQNGLALVLAGLLVVGYGAARLVARAAGSIARSTGHLGALAQNTSPDGARRVWSVVAAVFTAIALAITVASSARNQVDTSVGHLEQTQETAVWVSTASSDDFPVGFRFPAALAGELAAVPGVESVTTESISYAVRDGRRYALIGVDGPASYPVFALAGEDVMARVASGEGAVITTQYAEEFGIEVGDPVEVAGAESNLSLPVLAITRTVSISNYGTVTIGREPYVDAFGETGATGFQVFAPPGSDRNRLAAEIESVVRRGSAGASPVVIGTGEDWFAGAEGVYTDIANIFLVILGAIVALAGLATLNATASSVVERQRQLSVLRALGATRRQVQRIVLVEAVSAATLGVILGVAVGLFGHWSGVRITNNASPFPTDYAVSLPTIAQAVAAAGVAVILGALLPALQMSRSGLGRAVAYE